MSDFTAKMHQIQFRVGLCPRPRWGSVQRFPTPLAGEPFFSFPGFGTEEFLKILGLTEDHGICR